MFYGGHRWGTGTNAARGHPEGRQRYRHRGCTVKTNISARSRVQKINLERLTTYRQRSAIAHPGLHVSTYCYNGYIIGVYLLNLFNSICIVYVLKNNPSINNTLFLCCDTIVIKKVLI